MKNLKNISFSEDDVLWFHKKMRKADIDFWVDGGWGIDALLRRQTREHDDLDIVIEEKDRENLRKILGKFGFKDVPRDDTSGWNFVIGDESGRLIDLHVVVFDERGDGIYGPKEYGKYYPNYAFSGKGRIGNMEVKCISRKYQIESHDGYSLRPKDHADMKLLRENP